MMRTPFDTPPPPPWQLEGSAAISPWLVDARAARKLVPSPFEVLEVLPGYALGVVFATSYSSSPVGGYDEVGYAPALVQAGGDWGWYVSHLFVDSAFSRESGRSIWGLPKELARILWQHQDNRLQVDLDLRGQAVCRLHSRQRGAALPGRLRVPILSLRENVPVRSWLRLQARLAPGSSRLRVARGSPLEGLGLRVGLPSLWAWEARIELGEPEPIQKAEGNRQPGSYPTT